MKDLYNVGVSYIEEIDTIKARFVEAEQNRRQALRRSHRINTSNTEGYLGRRQIRRFNEVTDIVRVATGELMNDLGIDDYRFSPLFVDRSSTMGDREVDFVLLFNSSSFEDFLEDKDQVPSLRYHPGWWLGGLDLLATQDTQQVLIPRGLLSSPTLPLEGMMGVLKSPESNTLSRVRIQTTNITMGNVKDLWVIALSSPGVDLPRRVAVD